MPRLTADQRLEKLKAHQAEIRKAIAAARKMSRKAVTRRKIELGGLVMKARLYDVSDATLFGAFQRLREMLDEEPDLAATFARIGDKAWHAAAATRRGGHLGRVMVTFASAPADHVRAALKGMDFSYSETEKSWFGPATIAQVRAIGGFPDDAVVAEEDERRN